MKVTFFVKQINRETGEVSTRSWNADNIKNPLAYRKGILSKEEHVLGDTHDITVGFNAPPEEMEKLFEEIRAYKEAQAAKEAEASQEGSEAHHGAANDGNQDIPF